MRRSKHGFTLIEMLVVIAIISILVSILVPAVSSSMDKARASTDAANLRTVLGILNTEVLNGEKSVDEIIANAAHPTSKMDSGASLCVIYAEAGFIDVYYVNNTVYYGLEYLSELAENGPDSERLTVIGTGIPDVEGTWYTVTETP